MADSVVSARLRIDGVDQFLSSLARVKGELSALSTTRAKVDIDDTAAQQKLAGTTAAMKRLTAASYSRIKVDADMSAAMGKITALEAQMQTLVARQAVIKPVVDTSEAEGRISGLGAKMKDMLLGGMQMGIGMSASNMIASMFAGAKDAAIGFNAQLEQAQIGFTTMLGSADKATRFINDLKQFAATTPFEFGNLIPAAQRLLAMGFAAKEVIPTLTAVGNATAALGGNKEVLDRITVAMGQMLAKGKVSADEMRQLAEAGVPAWDMLAKAIGKTTAETMKLSENGAISAKTGIDALVTGMQERFGGMMEKQSRTLLGSLSNVKDILTQKAADAFLPFFTKMSEGMTKLADGLASPKFAEFAASVGKAMATAAAATMLIVEAIGKIPTPVFEAAAKIVALIGAFKLVGGAVTMIEGFTVALVGAVRASVAAFLAETEILAANTAAQGANAAARAANATAAVGAAGVTGAANVAGAAGMAATAGRAGLVTRFAGAASSMAMRVAVPIIIVGAIKDIVFPDDTAQRVKDAADKALAPTDRGIILNRSAAKPTAERVKYLQDTIAELQKQSDAVDKTLGSLDAKATRGLDNFMNTLTFGKWGGSEELQKLDANKAALKARIEAAREDLKQLTDAAAKEQSTADFKSSTIDKITEGQSKLPSDQPQAMSQIESNAAAAKRQVEGLRPAYLAITGDTERWNQLQAEAINLIDDQAKKQKEVLSQTILDNAELAKRAALLAKLGASGTDIQAGLTGGDKVAEGRLKAIEDAAAKQAKEDVAALTKAYDSLDAAAAKIDLSAPFTSLEKAVPALRQARDELASIGQTNFSSLDRLITIGQGLIDFQKNVQNAAGAFAAFGEMSSQTDGYIKQLETLKSNVQAAYKEIQAKPRSSWTADEAELVRVYATAIRGLDRDIAQLASNKVPDLLGQLKNAPDFVALDNQFRNFVAQYGGAEGLRVKIQMDVEDLAARKKVDSFLAWMKNPKDTRIDVLIAGDDKAEAALKRIRDGEDAILERKDILVVAKASGITDLATLQALVEALPTRKTVLVTVATTGGVTIPENIRAGGGAIPPYADGGTVTGDLAIVGDTKSGDMSAAEVVDFRNRRVFSHADSVRMGLLARGLKRYADGTEPPYRKDYTVPESEGGGGGNLPASVARPVAVVAPQATEQVKQATAATKELKRAMEDVSAEAATIVAQFAKMNALDISSTVQQFGQLFTVLDKVAQAKLGPNATQEQKDAATGGAMKQSLDFAAAWGQALTSIRTQDGNLADSIERVKAAAGPLADNYERQLSIMDNIARIGGTLADLAERRKAAEDAQTQVIQQRAAADRASQQEQTKLQRARQDFDTARERQRTATTRGDEDSDRARQRAQVRAQWAIDDERQAIQRKQREEDKGIQAAQRAREQARTVETRQLDDQRRAESDAWTTRTRQLEDIRRQAEFNGTEEKQRLVAERQALEDNYKTAKAAGDARAQLLSASARGGRTNEAAAAAAAKLADLLDQQTTAEQAYTTAVEGNQKLQDAEDKRQAKLLFDLETQRLAEQRAYEDRVREIEQRSLMASRAYEDESTRLNNLSIQRQAAYEAQAQRWQNEDTQRQRNATLEQERIDNDRLARNRLWEDESVRIADSRLAADRRYEDERAQIETTRLAEDQKYAAALADIDAEIAKQKDLQAAEESKLKSVQDVATLWSQVYDKAGASADALLTAFTEIVNRPAQSSSVPQAAPPPAFASGTAFFGGGAAITDERGGEAKVYPTGTMIIPADQTARMLKYSAPSGGSAYSITINQQPGEDVDALMARLQKMLDEREQAKAASAYRERIDVRYGARGGVR